MMRDLNSQSEELQKMFRALSGKRGSLAGETGRAGLLDSLALYQSTMAGLQGQARAMLQEIKVTHGRVLQTLAESHQTKKNFLELKQKAEHILNQLQVDWILAAENWEEQLICFCCAG